MAVWQVSVFLENKPGELADITGVLAEAGIDLRALNIAETTDYGVLRLIADDCGKACGILLDAGFVLSKTEVLALAVPDQPGGLYPVLRMFADAGVDVEYMYSIFSEKQGNAYMIMKLDDPGKAGALLKDKGITPAEPEELGIR